MMFFFLSGKNDTTSRTQQRGGGIPAESGGRGRNGDVGAGSVSTSVPWSFKLCGMFQMGCDLYLGWQWWVYGDGPGVRSGY